MDSEPQKISDTPRNDKRRASQQASGPSALQSAAGTEPDNKYYEVEEILDGPRKRREHLFKYCYKVRWKGYGPEADTWQPVADLANVQDMIEDYKKERAMKQREKGKKKPEEKHLGIRTRRSSSQSQMISSSDDDDDSDEDDKQYDPIYGTVKDKFWKDLELGRHQNHAQLFCGDMYSKVKGCRRAAHADAVANIQRHQQLLTKAHLISNRPSSSTPKQSLKLIAGNRQSVSKSQCLSSKSAYISGRSKSLKLSPISRVRKRSCDPFSARGYTSAKRSRRSKETKGGIVSPENKRARTSPLRSETLTQITDSSLGISPDESDTKMDTGSSHVLPSNPDRTDFTKVGATDSTTEATSAAVELTEDTTTTVELTEDTTTTAIQLTEDPAIQLTEDPAVQLTGDPAVELTGDPAVELTGDPAVELTGDPAVELTGDPAVELTGDPAVGDTTVEATDAPARTDDSNQDTVSSDIQLSTIADSAGMGSAEEPTEEDLLLADSETASVNVDKAADVPLMEESSRVPTDAGCFAHSSSVNVGASGDGHETISGLSYDDSGATSGGTLTGPSVIRKALSPKRSPLDAQSEASGAVERSHDEDCLWNGACNRSDCKSNRRRNMKNGQNNGLRDTASDSVDQSIGNENSLTDDENQNNNNNCSTVTVDGNCDRSQDSAVSCSSRKMEVGHNDTGALEFQAVECTGSSGILRKSLTDSLHVSPSQSSMLVCTSHQSSTSAQEDTSSVCSHTQNLRHSSLLPTGKSNSRSAGSSKPSYSSQYHSQGHACRSLFSSYHAESSDSSFDESPSVGVPLSREIVSDSFCRVDPLAHYHVQALAGSNTGRAVGCGSSPMYGSLGGNTSQGFKEIRKSSMEMERPGLFSDNNSAFSFTRQDSGFSGGSGSATPGEQHGQFTLPSPTGSINLCSPGKENFSSSNTKSGGLTVPGLYNRLPISVSVDIPSTNSDLTSQIQSLHSQPRVFSEPSENRAARKRNSEVSQPLEKIPSPNSRDTDLDRQISTLTCDELEDFVEQGEERCSQKDMAFITNADLLQAVHLSKAEVVKHAIRQFRFTEHKLDFEQADSMGVTLLMRAVQKGMLAIVEMLLEHGVNVNAQQTNGTTALMIAAEQNAVCLVALLLKYGANSGLYTVHTDRAETALMKAIKRQHQEVVNLMLRVGVNTAAPTCSSTSALELAVERRNPHIERVVRFHCQQLEQAFQSRVLATLEGTAELVEPLFPLQCFPLRECHQFVVKFISNIHSMAPGEGFLLFIAHTKITDKGVRCRFHGGCPIGSVTLNGITQTPLTKEVHFVTSCHPIVPGCNTLIIYKLADYTSKAKLIVQAFRARLLPC